MCLHVYVCENIWYVWAFVIDLCAICVNMYINNLRMYILLYNMMQCLHPRQTKNSLGGGILVNVVFELNYCPICVYC